MPSFASCIRYCLAGLESLSCVLPLAFYGSIRLAGRAESVRGCCQNRERWSTALNTRKHRDVQTAIRGCSRLWSKWHAAGSGTFTSPDVDLRGCRRKERTERSCVPNAELGKANDRIPHSALRLPHSYAHRPVSKQPPDKQIPTKRPEIRKAIRYRIPNAHRLKPSLKMISRLPRGCRRRFGIGGDQRACFGSQLSIWCFAFAA